ncbi:MAG: Ycf48-like protein precursor [Syntrophorhabdus sp. PtaU1.Bin058]|nr:MAG: Ycf48-like protein precursor [Syntrophorhabdus sp. PtaU1.Bin058]
MRPVFIGGFLLYLFLSMILVYPVISSAAVHAKRLHDDLFSVSFADDKEGWACGRWGTILHTKDGGKTWTNQKSGTDYTLSSIYFADAQHGWAVGDGGTILHTDNGGDTWQRQQSPVMYRLMSVHFVSANKGWAVGERTHILTTSDGGKTWTKQFSDVDYILKSVSFFDHSTGWAVGEYGYIYHTTNGGRTWENRGGGFRIVPETGDIEAGTFLFSIVATGPNTAMAVGIDGYVAKTEDAGKTWQPIATGGPKTQMFCVAVGKNGNMILAGGSGVFLTSVNRGRNWKNADFRPSISYGWIYGLCRRGASGYVAVGWQGSIFLNEDGEGMVWKEIAY